MKSKKQLGLAVIAATVLIVFAWYQVIWTGQNKAIAKANSAKATATAAAKSLATRSDALDAVKSDASRAKLLQRLDTAVPAEPSLPEYLRWVNALADETHVDVPSVGHSAPAPDTGAGATPAAAPVAAPGVTTVAVAPGAPAAAPAASSTLYRMSLTFQAMGTYGNILEFLHRLDSSDRLIVIDGVTLAPGGEAGAPAAPISDASGDPTVTTAPAEQQISATINAHTFSLGGIDATASTGANP